MGANIALSLVNATTLPQILGIIGNKTIFIHRGELRIDRGGLKSTLQYLSCYPCTCFGICQCMVMVLQAIAAFGSHGVKLVVRQVAELATRNA